MAPVVATLTLSESGQAENLLQDTVLILGRHTFEGVKSPHISRKQVQLTSKGDEITITNLGTNRSSLNGTTLSNNTPTKVKDGDKITLIEDKFEIRVKVFKCDSSMAQDTNKKESPVGSGSNASASGKKSTSSPLRPPPPFKKLGLLTTITTTTAITEGPKANSPPASKSPVAGTAISAIAASTTNAVTSTAIASGLTDIALTPGQSPTNILHNIKDVASKMEIVDDSENTSDSDKEDAMDVDARSSDISVESSFICEDLTDSGNDSDSDSGH